MGQAFDQSGRVLAEAFGDTKKEVLDKLEAAAPNAHEIRIKTLEKMLAKAQMPQGEEVPSDSGEAMQPGPMMIGRSQILTLSRRKELVRLAEEFADQLRGKVNANERCFFRRAVEMFVED
jgi:hypothetical protein